MQTIAAPSPNFDERPPGACVDMLVLHYTGMPTAKEALQRLCDPGAKVSAHYTVDEDGTVYAHVPEEHRAWHAGKSYWAGETNVNGRSIGIEIVNPGHEFGYRCFPDVQVGAVVHLCKDILARQPIPAWRVLGHSDVAPSRKTDPGELFPWGTLALSGVGLWPQTRKRKLAMPFAQGLSAFGYGIAPEAEASLNEAVIAFQRHFRPAKIDGLADPECEAILAALLAEIDFSA